MSTSWGSSSSCSYISIKLQDELNACGIKHQHDNEQEMRYKEMSAVWEEYSNVVLYLSWDSRIFQNDDVIAINRHKERGALAHINHINRLRECIVWYIILLLMQQQQLNVVLLSTMRAFEWNHNRLRMFASQ